MNEKIVIKFDNVTKRYKLYKNDKSRLLSLFCKNIKCKENVKKMIKTSNL